MTTRSSNLTRKFYQDSLEYEDFPAVAADVLYEGSGLGDSAGNARPLVAGDAFMGFAARQCDNAAGAAGAKKVRAIVKGKAEVGVVGVVSEDNHGATVYMSDDDVFTLTAGANTAVGKVARWVVGEQCVVAFEAAYLRSL